ncbi:hypothetical protein H6P81_012853 [Aristolochia fimbriata]|uniref:Uncharacterized protein n=1 Tax=Aristolochia fimbriata TaxID=158543 RepID=A0AAV7EF59_ARIFI|nr:hypothetical protein H6P81_012853 [Aristolochia fimbriata]
MEGFSQPKTRLKQKRCTPARDQNQSKVPLLSALCCCTKLLTTQFSIFRESTTVPQVHIKPVPRFFISCGRVSSSLRTRMEMELFTSSRPCGKGSWSGVEPGWARVRRENLNPN